MLWTKPKPPLPEFWPTAFPSSLALPLDRPKLFQNDSPLLCLILTHGSVLRNLCRDYLQIRTFLEACRLAINDESQQGGHATLMT